MKVKIIARLAAVAVGAVALAIAPSVAAQAYSPTPGLIYQLPANQACLKGLGNCAIYPKAAQLPNGRLVASFELATVPSSGSAIGETLPVYKSDDDGDTWQRLSQIQAPAFASSNPAYAKYTSNWTNPYLYVLPQAVGNLQQGTLMLASVVSGQDDYYAEQKAANPNWVPTNDGDRQDMAIALYSSVDNGSSWTFQNIITTGGWQGGSSGNIGQHISAANTYRQIDPVWEPYLIVYNNQLVAYYSDENDYIGYNATTGEPAIDPNNATAADSGGQILAHRTWDGSTNGWSSAYVDVAGNSCTPASGYTEIGCGRPGMENVVPTTDGKWLLTYEYLGGGDSVRYKIASDPLHFFNVGGAVGTGVSALGTTPGSKPLPQIGDPVIMRAPDGRIFYNAAGSGDVWVNTTGSSTGAWTQYHTDMPAGYSRNLTWDSNTGRVVILANQGQSTIIGANEDFGGSTATYYKIVNKATGQVIGTGGNLSDADLSTNGQTNIVLETSGSAANAATESWHVQAKSDGSVTLLNKANGRAASIWTGSASAGQVISPWTDDVASGPFRMVTKSNGLVYFQSVQDPTLYLTGTTGGSALTLQKSDNGGGTQDWTLVAQ